MSSCIFTIKGLFLCASFVLFITQLITFTGALQVGVNYGMVADNLPTPDKVIALYKSRNIQRLRLFDPNPAALEALHGSGIHVILGTRNEDLPKLATDSSYAKTWINTNVIPHANTVSFRCISAGNEVIPGDLANYVLPALQNLDAALKAANMKIPVSTAVSMQVMGVSYPPSAGAFSNVSNAIMRPLLGFLATNRYPLLANVYPYFAYASNPKEIRLDYALFSTNDVVVTDGPFKYKNLFHAMVDSLYSAIEKAGGSRVSVIVSETGWPSSGNEDMATLEHARTYNNKLIAQLAATPGTPKRPGQDLETYIFAMFNEDLKPVGVETNFGLYHPDTTEVFHVNFFPTKKIAN